MRTQLRLNNGQNTRTLYRGKCPLLNLRSKSRDLRFLESPANGCAKRTSRIHVLGQAHDGHPATAHPHTVARVSTRSHLGLPQRPCTPMKTNQKERKRSPARWGRARPHFCVTWSKQAGAVAGSGLGKACAGRHARLGQRRLRGEAEAYLDHCLAHGSSCSKRMSSP